LQSRPATMNAAADVELGVRTDVILGVLLQHHRRVRLGAIPGSGLLTIDRLCARAGMPEYTGSVAVSLVKVARWCADRGWPPLNALAVNKETGKPGAYYRLAAGCTVLGWRDEVAACLAFDGYPPPRGSRQDAPSGARIGAMPARVARRLAGWLGTR
jgi:hypothetical protein